VDRVDGRDDITRPVRAGQTDSSAAAGDLMDMITPTNGAVLAVLLAADVPYDRWIKFSVPGALLVSIVGLVGIALARRGPELRGSLKYRNGSRRRRALILAIPRRDN
jgi:hypothetical protein